MRTYFWLILGLFFSCAVCLWGAVRFHGWWLMVTGATAFRLALGWHDVRRRLQPRDVLRVADGLRFAAGSWALPALDVAGVDPPLDGLGADGELLRCLLQRGPRR